MHLVILISGFTGQPLFILQLLLYIAISMPNVKMQIGMLVPCSILETGVQNTIYVSELIHNVAIMQHYVLIFLQRVVLLTPSSLWASLILFPHFLIMNLIICFSASVRASLSPFLTLIFKFILSSSWELFSISIPVLNSKFLSAFSHRVLQVELNTIEILSMILYNCLTLPGQSYSSVRHQFIKHLSILFT